MFIEDFMLDYNGLYEIVRKEKYSENLQKLDSIFLMDFAEYLKNLRGVASSNEDLFSDGVSHSKKQLENSIALFKGLILRRKKKLLNLVFVAAETGIMKKDYENMFDFEKKVFDCLIKSIESGDKELSSTLNGISNGGDSMKNKMIIFTEKIDEFVDMNGNAIGPFDKGELVNLDATVCDILVSGGKANFVDE